MNMKNVAAVLTLFATMMCACQSSDSNGVFPETSNTITLAIGESKTISVLSERASSYVRIKFDSVSENRCTRQMCTVAYTSACKAAIVYCEVEISTKPGWKPLILERISCEYDPDDTQTLVNNQMVYTAAGRNFVLNFLTNVDDVLDGESYSIAITAVQ